MSEIKWIKITTDIFDDEKILLIESLPEADSIIVIWFKLLCLAGKMNNSGVFMLNDRIAYTDTMLATIFRRKENTVKLALETFERFGMIEMVNDVITIPNWGKHQSTDALENKREYQRNYMRDYREKQKQIACKTNSETNSEANVSSLDKDITDIKIKEDIYTLVDAVIDYLNKTIGAKYKSRTKKTVELVRARANEGFTLEDFQLVISKKSAEWLNTDMAKFLRPETLFGTKFEGYLNQTEVKKTNEFNNFAQRGYDWKSLEKELLAK